MQVKYTSQFLNTLEELFAESDYILRYEKGNFKSGYCVLKDTKIAIVNKYFTLEGKINSLVEIIRTVALDVSKFSVKSKKVYFEITQTNLNF
ncbi:MAG TPA: hypothetical protein VD908_01085 [Cytophagales bacterium]|nr:hypothetical protein [Cytophagales bacterium]